MDGNVYNDSEFVIYSITRSIDTTKYKEKIILNTYVYRNNITEKVIDKIKEQDMNDEVYENIADQKILIIFSYKDNKSFYVDKVYKEFLHYFNPKDVESNGNVTTFKCEKILPPIEFINKIDK